MEKDEKNIYGPTLPLKVSLQSPQKSCDENNDAYGPTLPPHLRKSEISANGSTIMGPMLPPHLREKLQQEAATSDIQEDSSDEEEEAYGPVLPGQTINSKSALALEERALEIKLGQLCPEERKPEREEWMIELPTVSASKLGLGPRQFRPNPGPDMSDRSSWTDTPNSKKKIGTVNLSEEIEKKEAKRKDKKQEKLIKKHKRQSQSLLELHQEKCKKQKASSEAPKERVPFNRETDLQVNKFDEAQKKAVLKKAQLLDDRFSQGRSKFL